MAPFSSNSNCCWRSRVLLLTAMLTTAAQPLLLTVTICYSSAFIAAMAAMLL
jgi:hypothetical protein